MMIETTFSLLTVVCQAKKMFNRTVRHLEARLSYMAAMFFGSSPSYRPQIHAQHC
jgi:hypothetical protein